MNPTASEQETRAVERRVEQAQLHIKRIDGDQQTVIAAVGDPALVQQMSIEGMSGVDRVVPVSRPYKLASSELTDHHQPTTVSVALPDGSGEVLIGRKTFTMIAGPCTVESRNQTLVAAQACKEGGAAMLRGGVFKPRTSPFAFQGLGEEGIDILAQAREQTNLPVVSEAKNPEQAQQLYDSGAVDVLQVGARNMQNYELLEAVGHLPMPVILKRGLASTVDELLMAADYILAAGQENVIVCERGIRTFETATRFTLDLGAIPYIRQHSHLPVIVDPSHAAGQRNLVEDLSCAAAAAGADGIIVEVTDDPESARCDGPQQLYAHSFAAYNSKVLQHAQLRGRVSATG